MPPPGPEQAWSGHLKFASNEMARQLRNSREEDNRSLNNRGHEPARGECLALARCHRDIRTHVLRQRQSIGKHGLMYGREGDGQKLCNGFKGNERMSVPPKWRFISGKY
jgi:hypothetical protein